MERDFIMFITDDLRPYLRIIDFALESLKRQMNTPLFQWPATRIGNKPTFARIMLSEKAQALIEEIKSPKQTEQEVLIAALVLAKRNAKNPKDFIGISSRVVKKVTILQKTVKNWSMLHF